MCSRISWFIQACILTAVDVIVFITVFFYEYVDSIQWPVFRAVHCTLKCILGKLFEKERQYPEVCISGGYEIKELQRGKIYVEDLLRVINDEFISKQFIIRDKVVGYQNTRIKDLNGEVKLCTSLRMSHAFRRCGNCSLKKEGEISRVNATISGCMLHIDTTIHMEMANLTKAVNVTGYFPYIEAYIELYFNNETLQDGRLTEFIILDMHEMKKLRFGGAGPLNMIPKFILNNLVKVFKGCLKTVLQKEIQTKLNILVANFRFPVATMPRTPDCSPSSVQLYVVPYTAERSSPSEKQRVVPDNAPTLVPTRHSSPVKQQQVVPDTAPTLVPTRHLSPVKQQRTVPDTADGSSPSEQQRAVPVTVDDSSPSEQKGAIPYTADSSSPLEKQRVIPDTDDGPSLSEQQVVPDTANDSSLVKQKGVVPNTADSSSPSEQQRAVPVTVDGSSPSEQKGAVHDTADDSSPTELKQAVPETTDGSSPSEQQRTIPDTADGSSPSERQRVVPDTSDGTPCAEQQRVVLDTTDGSPFQEQQRVVPLTAERSPPTEQRIEDISTTCPHSND